MSSLHTRAGERAMEIVHELRDPETVAAALCTRAAHTLCYGLAGTALLHACLTNTDPNTARTAAAHWRAAGRALGTVPADGIHTGPGALAASLIIGTGYLPSHDPHHALLPRATAWLSARATALAHHHHQRAEQQQATSWAVYDAIKGLAGIGRVLLTAHHRGHQEAEPGLHSALQALTHMILTPLGRRPGWWLPADLHPPTVHVPTTGAATTGLAHGIAGPLSFLATAHHAGCTVPGQPKAIRIASEWLLNWRTPQYTWPPHVSGAALDAGPQAADASVNGRTTAWCYGTPGIATALNASGRALDATAFHTGAAEALSALAVRLPETWDTEGGALCHGTAGILQTAQRLSQPALAEHAACSTLTDDTGAGKPALLTGQAGTALALAEYAGLLPADLVDRWDALLLLS